MNEDRIEALLRGINNKLKNRNIFTWKVLFGWLIAMPLGLIGAALFKNASELMGFIFIVAAALSVIINLIIGVMALYKSTKDSK
ncbi:MAG: hypothetical protein LBL52_01575 [Rickettsiales bacterium]|jgi:hypothetical protein|nr:hypothetical protein [Rickettsiales bacterium]